RERAPTGSKRARRRARRGHPRLLRSGDHAALAFLRLRRSNLDLLRLLLRSRLLRNGQLQHAVFELGLHVLEIRVLRQRERAAEAAVRALPRVVRALFVALLALRVALTRDAQAIAGQRDVE